MVFHIAGTLNIFRVRRCALEFREDVPEWLIEHVCEKVQATTMGHAHNEFFKALAGCRA